MSIGPVDGLGHAAAPADFRTAVTAPELPATQGLRGALAHVGILVAPSRAESDRRRDTDLVRRGWVGSRTVAVLGALPGAGATTVSAVLAAPLAAERDGGVLVWDLSGGGLAAGVLAAPGEGRHRRFAEAVHEIRPDALVHTHQEDGYAVLRGGAASMRALFMAARGAFPLILIEAGWNEDGEGSADRALEVADRVVLVTGTEPDDAAAVLSRVRALQRSDRGRALAEQALAVVTSTGRTRTSAVRRTIGLLEPLVGGVVHLPDDAGLRTSAVRSGGLAATTARLALTLAAGTLAAL